jgi:hypothetical protein
MLPETYSELLLHVTLRLRTDDVDGGHGIGTGFLYRASGNAGAKTLLVTNEHVVEDASLIHLRLHEGIAQRGAPIRGASFPHAIADPTNRISHDTEDLCVFDFDAIISSLAAEPYHSTLQPDMVWDDQRLEAEFGVVEDVLMVGYPNGLYDEKHELPLIRRGTTASPAWLDHNGDAQGVIDAGCYEGSSGSPIFIVDEPMIMKRKSTGSGRALLTPGGRCVLLGVLASHAVMSVEGTMEKKRVPTRHRSVPTTDHALHLGYYVKAVEVEALAQRALKTWSTVL